MVKRKRKPYTSCARSLKSGCSFSKVVESLFRFQEVANEFRRLLQMIRWKRFVPSLMTFGNGSSEPPTALLSFPMKAPWRYGNRSIFLADGRNSLRVSRLSTESILQTITIDLFQSYYESFQRSEEHTSELQ